MLKKILIAAATIVLMPNVSLADNVEVKMLNNQVLGPWILVVISNPSIHS